MCTSRTERRTGLHRSLARLLLCVVPILALLAPSPALPADYYVDSAGGMDTGDGSQPDPWQTLSMVNAMTLAPGDRVFLKRGSEFRERLIIDEFSDGTASDPIVVDAYGDDADPVPVISGGEVIPIGDSGWTGPDTHGTYRRPLGDTLIYYTCCPNLVRADPAGVETYTLLARGINTFDGGTDLDTASANLAPDSYFTNIESPDGRVLYYKPTAGTVPQDFEFEIGKRDAAILIDGDHVEIRNVQAILNNVGNPAVDAAVFALGTNFTIRDCKVAFGRAFGIMVFGADSLVDGCVAEHNNSTGIVAQGTAATGTVIQNNIVRFNGNLDFQDRDRGGIGTQSSDTIIRDNVVHDNGNIDDNTPPRIAGDAAIAIFESHNVLVEGNFIYNSARSGIQDSHGPETYGLKIIGNVIYNWNLVGPVCDPTPTECPNPSGPRSAISVTGFGDTATSGLVEILNNTIYTDQVEAWVYGILIGLPTNDDYLRDSLALNNIVSMPNNTDSRAVGLRTTRSHHFENVEIDYNDVYMPVSPGPNHYEAFGVIGPNMADLGEPEYEVHSLHVDPALNLGVANPADPVRYDLLPGSPVIDAGVDVGRTEDFLDRPVPVGAAPDMGAFESPSFCVDDDLDGVCDDVDVCLSGPLVVDGFLAPMGPLSPEGEAPVAPDKAFKSNRTLPLKFTATCDGLPLTDLDMPAPTISEVAREGDAIGVETADLDSGKANDDGLEFRFSDDVWVYNLGTRGLEAGSYIVSVTTPEDVSYAAAFVLR